MPVSGESDFYAIWDFPEVYHGQERSKAVFTGAVTPARAEQRGCRVMEK